MMEKNKITTLEEHLTFYRGAQGTSERVVFDAQAKAFIVAELLKEERHNANLTQSQLAELTGMKKSYISRVENGHADIQLSTLFKIIELGFGKKLLFSIQ
jgi:HTH-type transcriptional regulator / antitoxin HipB